MARQPGTIDTDDVKRQLESFFSRAVDALGEVKDAVVRTSQVGKIKLDATFLRRERDRLFQRLGEELFDLAEDGKLTLPEDVGSLVEQLRDLERKLTEQEQEIAHVRSEAQTRRAAEQAEAERAGQKPSGEKYDDQADEDEDDETAVSGTADEAEEEEVEAATVQEEKPRTPRRKPAAKKSKRRSTEDPGAEPEDDDDL